MRNREEISAGKDNSTRGALLYVTELTDDSPEALNLALKLAASHGVRLEMVHVVDLDHVQSSPDGQMGIQFRLDALARSLRHLKHNVASALLFGSPEDVITRRAHEIKAKLIAFARHGQSSAGAQAAMVKRLASKVACPVVVLPTPGI
jgi:nucleotide-binding universal stress UspA family protein